MRNLEFKFIENELNILAENCAYSLERKKTEVLNHYHENEQDKQTGDYYRKLSKISVDKEIFSAIGYLSQYNLNGYPLARIFVSANEKTITANYFKGDNAVYLICAVWSDNNCEFSFNS